MMVNKIITPTILIIVAALSWWYIKTLEKSLSQTATVSTAGPDYFMHDAVSTLLDDTGTPKHRLETTYMAHFAEDNRTELKDAYLTLHQQDGSLWSVKAKQGTLFQTTEQIYLEGDVVIERPSTDLVSESDAKDSLAQTVDVQPGTQYKKSKETGEPAPPSQAGIKIETDTLHIDPNLQIAQTTDPVVISSQDSRVNAVGMKANLQTKSVELLAKVKGIYVPPREQSR